MGDYQLAIEVREHVHERAPASGGPVTITSTAIALTSTSARFGSTMFCFPSGDVIAAYILSGVNSAATRATPCLAIQCNGRRSLRRTTSESLTIVTPCCPERASNSAGVPA